jgi:hypothetical protein
MSVVILQFFYSPVDAVLMFLVSGRNRDYQHLNLTFAVNVMKYATILSFVPRPLKPCAAVLIHGPLSPPLKHILALWHACYRTSLPRFDKRLNLSDLWSRSGSRRWMNLETTGTSRFVNHVVLVFLSLHGEITERYAHVADGGGQGSGEVP